jgi:DNA-binding XRE family transcriptional regulator
MPKNIKPIETPDLSPPLTPALLGKAIKARRTQSKLRQEDAAALCGVAKQTFMQVEHGHPSCQLDTVIQICTALGIKLSILPWDNANEEYDDWT